MPTPCIGVFDSGVGGLGIACAVRRLLPHVPLRYLADSAHAPYGHRGEDFIRERSVALSAELIRSGARLVVVACNTATALAVDTLRMRFPNTHFVGVEPGIKRVCDATQAQRIGVLATPATLQSQRLAALISRHGGNRVFTLAPAAGVVEAVETGDFESEALRQAVQIATEPLRHAGVSAALLGCTHFPFIRELWQDALPGVQLVEVEQAVARQVQRKWGPVGETPTEGSAAVWTTSGAPGALMACVRRLSSLVPGTGLEPVRPC